MIKILLRISGGHILLSKFDYLPGAHPVVRALSDLSGIIETFGLRDKDDLETRYTKYTTCYVYGDDD